MERKNYSDNSLVKMYSKHISYEIDIFRKIGFIFSDALIQTNDTLRSVLIESAALHIRNLFDFFLAQYLYENREKASTIKPKKPYNTDTIAEDYLDNNKISEWYAFIYDLIDNSNILEIKDRVNKEVTHLTYHRLDVKKHLKGWLEEFEISFDYIAKLQNKHFELMPNRLRSRLLSDH